ncbi:MAG: cyclase family protein [Deltaproteobacteria bacterium]|nr:cyclase family protein [Deltaproteobacteria bacterium]
MTILDLTLPLNPNMAVYPGDPPVEIDTVHTLETHGWELRRISLGTHAGTHVNVPSHMISGGASLADLPLTRFQGPTVLWRPGSDAPSGLGLIVAGPGLDMDLVPVVLAAAPPFVGFPVEAEPDPDVEKALLAAGIVVYENLLGVDRLSSVQSFQFWGLPLTIMDGDGSPIRAVALVD